MPPGRRHQIAAVLVVVAVAGYLWPSLARDPARLDVIVVGDGAVADAADEIGRQIRQLGLSVDVREDGAPCTSGELSAALARDLRVIVSYRSAATAACREALVEQLAGATAAVTVLTQDGALTGPDGPSLVEVDPSWLVPPTPGASSGCQWWEPPPPTAAPASCEPGGSVTVRDESGELTIAGRDRFARVLAGTLR